MKRFTLLPLLLAFLTSGPLSSSVAASTFWPHWGHDSHSSQRLPKRHHSAQPKAAHPHALKSLKHTAPRT
jgi:hypothetical protein